MKIQVGMKVRFDPYRERGIGKPEMEGIFTDTVVYINEPHRWFGVTYGPGLADKLPVLPGGGRMWFREHAT